MARVFLVFFPLSLFIVLGAYVSWRNAAPARREQQSIRLQMPVKNELRLVFVGDTGSGREEQKQVAAAMETYCQSVNLDALVFLGDNFYPKGVASTDDPQWQSKFHDLYSQGCLASKPVFAILGNHDYQGKPEAQIAYTDRQKQWIMPHRFYSVEWPGLLKMIAIDSSIPDFCGSPENCTIDFLLQELKSKSQPLTFILGHHPIASTSRKYKQSLEGFVFEKLFCSQPGYYISGHSHHLEHRTIEHCALEQLVSGGGGAGLYETDNEDAQAKFASSSHGFLSALITPHQLKLSFYDEKLRRIYETHKVIASSQYSLKSTSPLK